MSGLPIELSDFPTSSTNNSSPKRVGRTSAPHTPHFQGSQVYRFVYSVQLFSTLRTLIFNISSSLSEWKELREVLVHQTGPRRVNHRCTVMFAQQIWGAPLKIAGQNLTHGRRLVQCCSIAALRHL